jgi:hypothetical protein
MYIPYLRDKRIRVLAKFVTRTRNGDLHSMSIPVFDVRYILPDIHSTAAADL